MLRELRINNYKLMIILGNNPIEKLAPREVILNLKIKFNEELGACNNDNLDYTICYSKTICLIKNAVENKDFNLIESLAKFIYDVSKDYIKTYVNDVLLHVEIIKPSPVEHLESVSFVYSDME